MPELPFKMPDPNFKAPDLMEAVEGWRVWRCTFNPKDFEAPKLHSATWSNYYWWPRKFAEATCDRCNEPPPNEHCSCGFYSAKSLEHLLSLGYHPYDLDKRSQGEQIVMVLGRIANWGKVIEGTQGWRAQFAYPAKLWVPFEAAHLAGKLSETYGVPVALKNILGASQSTKKPFLSPAQVMKKGANDGC